MPAPTIERDLDKLLDQLRSARLLVRETSSARRLRQSLGAWLGNVFLRVFCSRRGGLERAGRLLTAAKISIRVAGFARSIDLWRAHFQPCGRTIPGAEKPTIPQIDTAVRQAAARHFLKMECKERALACWGLLRLEGWAPALVIGIDPFPLWGHCWCEAGSQIVSDDPAHCQRFTPVVRFS
jgi:hypothetical protein